MSADQRQITSQIMCTLRRLGLKPPSANCQSENLGAGTCLKNAQIISVGFILSFQEANSNPYVGTPPRSLQKDKLLPRA